MENKDRSAETNEGSNDRKVSPSIGSAEVTSAGGV